MLGGLNFLLLPPAATGVTKGRRPFFLSCPVVAAGANLAQKVEDGQRCRERACERVSGLSQGTATAKFCMHN